MPQDYPPPDGRLVLAETRTRLTVRETKSEDFYKDIVRMDTTDRQQFGVEKGDPIRMRVENSTWTVAFLRGGSKEGEIRMDGNLRDLLGVKEDYPYDFSIEKAGKFDQLRWALKASDPAYRIATMFAVIAMWLGVLAVLLALPIFFEWMSKHI